MAELNPDPNTPKSGLQERIRGFRLTTKYQKSGEAYLQRRNEEALVRWDTRMIDDVKKHLGAPLMVGLVLGLIGLIGSVIGGVLFPPGKVKDADLVQDSATGALFVRVGETLSPVLNVASARLILGKPAVPVQAKTSEIEKSPRGPLVGIAYAPDDIRDTSSRESRWAVCDTAATGSAVPLDPSTGLPTTATAPVKVTVIGGALTDNEGTADIDGSAARVVSYENQTWLLYAINGQTVRAPIDLKSSTVTDALGISDSTPVVPMSAGLFNALAARQPIAAPTITDLGKPARFANTEKLAIGTTFRVQGVDGQWSYYVVAADGVKQISVTAAAILQPVSPDKSGARAIEAEKLAQWPKVSDRIAVGHFPPNKLKMIDASSTPVTCFSWKRDGDDPAATQRVFAARTLPLTREQEAGVVQLVGARSSRGTIADQSYMPPTSGRYIQVTGSAPDSKEAGGQFWIADRGVRFGIDDLGARDEVGSSAAALGLKNPVPAPWSVVRLFAVGPTLSKNSAALQHDGGPPDPVVATFDPKPR